MKQAGDKLKTPGAASDWTLTQRAFVALGWAVFLWAWVTVMHYTAVQTMIGTVILLVAGMAAVEVVDLMWIKHNLNIYKKKGPRKSVPKVGQQYRRDFLGRALIAEQCSLLEDDLIVVDFDERRKTFVPLHHGMGHEELARNLKPVVVPTSLERKEEAI